VFLSFSLVFVFCLLYCELNSNSHMPPPYESGYNKFRITGCAVAQHYYNGDVSFLCISPMAVAVKFVIFCSTSTESDRT